MTPPPRLDLRSALWIVASANLAYFAIETSVAVWIGSVSLMADGIDFLEDAVINLLILAALARGLAVQRRVALVLAAIMVIPSAAAAAMAVAKFLDPVAPAAATLSITGVGALIVNVGCAFLLVRFRAEKGSLTKAAFLSARNDALANLLIIAAGIATLWWVTGWPDLIVGAIILAINLEAAWEVYKAATREAKEIEHART